LRKTVLIVDDDAGIRKAFARILQRNGYTADVASNGKEALQKVTAKKYDAALVDICLPDLNGLELLDQMQRAHRNMVIIVITGNHIESKEDIKADEYLLKPVNPEDLIRLIEQKIAKKQANIGF